MSSKNTAQITKKNSKTSKNVKIKTKEADFPVFIQVMTDLRTFRQVEIFCSDFFTESEKHTFSKRLAICLALRDGKSYEVIRKELGVSSATISSIAEQMTSTGFQLAIEKIENEAWAESMAKKISHIFPWMK